MFLIPEMVKVLCLRIRVPFLRRSLPECPLSS
jgi:hypothetical protein